MIESLLANPILILALFAATIVLGVGRLSRVLTYDPFPPAIALRQWWGRVTGDGEGGDGPWTKLLNCFWCLTPWLLLGALGWFALTFLAVWIAWTWWLFWGWLALSYLASMVIARDEP